MESYQIKFRTNSHLETSFLMCAETDLQNKIRILFSYIGPTPGQGEMVPKGLDITQPNGNCFKVWEN